MKIFQLFTSIVLFIFLGIVISNAQITKRISFDTLNIQKTVLTKGYKNFERISYKNSVHMAEEGKPDLPSKLLTFYIPYGKTVADLTVKCLKQEIVYVGKTLFPVQNYSNDKNIKQDFLYSQPDSLVYSQDEFYPKELAAIYEQGFMDGNLHTVTIEVHPFQYNGKQNKLRLNTVVELSLVLKPSNISKSSLNLSTQPKLHDSTTIAFLKSIVQNPENVPEFDSIPKSNRTKSALKTGAISWSVPFYEYVIVTTKALKSSFMEYVAWKRLKGLNAGVVCIEDILADNAATGDELSPSFLDENLRAGKLRQYLKAGWNANITKFALLGGGVNVGMPIMYGYGGDILSFTWKNGYSKIPSDLYFSEFNTNWTKMSNEKTGSYYYLDYGNDIFDYTTDIYIGRLLVTTETEVKNWVNKALLYEQYPGKGDYSYLTKWLATQADIFQASQDAEIIKTNLPQSFTTKTILNEEINGIPSYNALNPTFPKNADVINEFNTTHYGIISCLNHGGASNYGVLTAGDCNACDDLVSYASNIYSNSSYQSASNPEPAKGINNFTNYNYPAIFYSCSCESAPFDGFGVTGVQRNLAEAFTCMYNNGGPAFIGSTRYALTDRVTGIYSSFLSHLNTNPIIGKAVALSRANGVQHYAKLSHNLIGCPEMPVWTAIPLTFSNVVTYWTTGIGTKTYYVNTNVPGCKISLLSANDLGKTYAQVFDNTSSASFIILNYADQNNFILTITKPNYIPYQVYPATLPTQFIQNQNINQDLYVIAKDIFSGNHVTNLLTQGDVVIKSNSSVVFQSIGGEITLDSGFEVENGASFEVILK